MEEIPTSMRSEHVEDIASKLGFGSIPNAKPVAGNFFTLKKERIDKSLSIAGLRNVDIRWEDNSNFSYSILRLPEICLDRELYVST